MGRIKRFLGYASINNIGFILISLVNFVDYVQLYIFLFVYIINQIHFFLILLSFKPINKSNISFFLFPIFWKSNKVLTIHFMISLFSFAGIPPLLGFLSKFVILKSIIINSNLLAVLTVILVTLLSTIYYLRLIQLLIYSNKIVVSEQILKTISFKISWLISIISFILVFSFLCDFSFILNF